MKTLVKSCLKKLGYELVRRNGTPNLEHPYSDLSESEKKTFELLKPFTMTSVERITALIQATEYLVENRIEGDVAECGVWRGGSMMAVALTLKQMGDTTRNLFLYDTFAGMSAPSERDRRFDGVPAEELLRESDQNAIIWCYASLEDVRSNLLTTGYPESKIHFVEGRIEETIPRTLPDRLCLLRLDTDWYESTMHELMYLYPKLVEHGVLIIDDYGHWRGVKEATDNYFGQRDMKPFFHRIDYTGRLVIKLGEERDSKALESGQKDGKRNPRQSTN